MPCANADRRMARSSAPTWHQATIVARIGRRYDPGYTHLARKEPEMREYRLISADSHVLEPPDLWQKRLPAKYKDRAPHMVSLEKGDAWICEGAVDPINFG